MPNIKSNKPEENLLPPVVQSTIKLGLVISPLAQKQLNNLRIYLLKNSKTSSKAVPISLTSLWRFLVLLHPSSVSLTSSGPSTPGEGEMKILQQMKKLPKNESCVVVSGYNNTLSSPLSPCHVTHPFCFRDSDLVLVGLRYPNLAWVVNPARPPKGKKSLSPWEEPLRDAYAINVPKFNSLLTDGLSSPGTPSLPST